MTWYFVYETCIRQLGILGKILCNKIVINPKEGLAIEKPKKGDEVSREEYQEIVVEKTKEMAERFGNGRRRGPGGRG